MKRIYILIAMVAAITVSVAVNRPMKSMHKLTEKQLWEAVDSCMKNDLPKSAAEYVEELDKRYTQSADSRGMLRLLGVYGYIYSREYEGWRESKAAMEKKVDGLWSPLKEVVKIVGGRDDDNDEVAKVRDILKAHSVYEVVDSSEVLIDMNLLDFVMISSGRLRRDERLMKQWFDDGNDTSKLLCLMTKVHNDDEEGDIDDNDRALAYVEKMQQYATTDVARALVDIFRASVYVERAQRSYNSATMSNAFADKAVSLCDKVVSVIPGDRPKYKQLVDMASRLKKSINEINISVEVRDNVPDVEIPVSITTCNAYSVSVDIYDWCKEFDMSKLKPLISQNVDLHRVKGRLQSEDTKWKMQGLKAGRYIAVVHADTVFSHADFRISDIGMYDMEVGEKGYFAVMSATTGAPLVGATVDGKAVDEMGLYTVKEKPGRHEYEVKYKDEHFGFTRWIPRKSNDDNSADNRTVLLTDRGLYRPGQKVCFKLWRFWADREKLWPAETEKFEVRLRGEKDIASVSVTPSILGCAWGEIDIPSDVKTGRYSIIVNGRHVQNIAIEEYKLTGNKIEFDDIREVYYPMDTVVVGGRLLTVDDVPVSGAMVTVNDTTELQTDADGHFTYSLVAQDPDMDRYGFDTITKHIFFKATDRGGETVEKTFDVKVFRSGYHPDVTVAPSGMADKSCYVLGSQMTFTLSLYTGMSHDVSGDVHYYIERLEKHLDQPVNGVRDQYSLICEKEMHIEKGETIVIDTRDYVAGTYHIRAVSTGKNGKTDTSYGDFTLLPRTGALVGGKMDIYAMGEKHFVPGHEYRMSVGTNLKDAYLYVVAVRGSECVHKSVVRCSEEMKEISINVPSTGGANGDMEICLFAMKDNERYNSDASVDCREEESAFVLSMQTMRDHSQPGAQETVRLKLRSDRPLDDSEVAATMFDSRLDNIVRYRWDGTLGYFRPCTTYSSLYVQAVHPSDEGCHIVGDKYRYSSYHYFIASPSCDEILDIVMPNMFNVMGHSTIRSRSIRTFGAPSLAKANDIVCDYDMASFDDEVVEEEMIPYAVVEGKTLPPFPPVPQMEEELDIVGPTPEDVTLRNNFAESVFFEPALRPDADGNVEVSFTLPDNITKYNFMAFATDKKMRASYLFAQMKVNKPLAVKTWLPRLLTEGDTIIVSLSANVDKAFEVGELTYTLSCDEKACVEQIDKSHFRLVAPSDVDTLTITYTVTDGKYSDGEKHSIPVISRYRQIDESQAFVIYPHTTPTLINEGYSQLNMTTATWEAVVEALPHLYDSRYPCSDTYAGQIETSAIAMTLQRRGDIADWIARHKDDKDNRAVKLLMGDNARRMFADAVVKLKNMQRSNGAFPWIEGMDESEYMTRAIVNTLVDLRRYTSLQDKDVDTMIENGLGYIKGLVKKSVEMWKEHKIEHPVTDEEMLYDLYILARAGKLDKSDKAISAALAAIPKGRKLGTPVNKVLAAVIYDSIDRRKDAALLVQSVCENLIRPDDNMAHISLRGHFWYADDMFVHPILVMALNDLQMEIGDAQKICNWMMKAKRSTHWGNTQSTSRAVFALLSMSSDHRNAKTVMTINSGNGAAREMILSNSTSVDAAEISNVVIDHQGVLPIWGNWHRESRMAIDQMAAHNQEDISIVRTIEGAQKVGDKVRVTISVTTAIDMDHVRISDYRPASFQPVDQTSGYRGWWWLRTCGMSDGVIHYYSPRDASVDLFVERLPRGTHTFSYECYVTNAGEMNAGYAEVVCMYEDALEAHTAGCRSSLRSSPVE